MGKFGLLFAALVVAAASLLTIVPAPPSVLAWKLAIVVGEYGHWMVLPALVLAIVGLTATRGWFRVAVPALFALAACLLLRPAISAEMLATTLPRALGAAFGEMRQTAPAFSVGRLFRSARPPTVDVITEVYSQPEGQDLKVDFYRPQRRLAEHAPDRGPAPRPACVLVVHGGGWDAGDRRQLAGLNHRLALAGYAVASIDYRLAPIWQWPAPREDTLAALAWLKVNAIRLGIDPANIVLLGRSAGAQIAEVVGYTAHDSAIRGVISFYGPSDLVFGYRNADENDAIRSPSLMRAFLGGSPDQQLARYEDASALRFVSPGSPPTLLLHGFLDTLVWHRHDERLAARLAEAGVPHYFLSLPWATHGFDYNPNGPGGQLADFAVFGFLDRVTRPPAPAR